jgi:hypothetical protein
MVLAWGGLLVTALPSQDTNVKQTNEKSQGNTVQNANHPVN